MAQVNSRFAHVRSLLVVDPLRASTTDLDAPADALVLDMTVLAEVAATRKSQIAAVVTLLGRLRARAYSPLLLIRIAAIDAAQTEDVLDTVMPAKPDGLLISACTDPARVQGLGVKLSVREATLGLPESSTAVIADMGATPAGLLAGGGFRLASTRLVGLSWDAAALATACGATPGTFSDDETPQTIARTLVSLAAGAAGVFALDTPSTAQGETLARECAAARRLGFSGKITREASQVAVLNTIFARSTPTATRALRSQSL